MRSLRPGIDADEALRGEELEKLKITPPSEAQDTGPTPERPRTMVTATEAKFEKILQQELSGTSFSFDVDRTVRTTVNAQSQPATKKKLIPLSKAKQLKASPFHGETILDKFVSFVAYLLKALERLFFRKNVAAPQKQKNQIKPEQSAGNPTQKSNQKKEKATSRWMRWSRM